MLLQLRMMQEPRSATMEEITAVHDIEYVQQLKDTADNKAPTVVADFDDPDGFTYMTSTSFDDALKVFNLASLGKWPPVCLQQHSAALLSSAEVYQTQPQTSALQAAPRPVTRSAFTTCASQYLLYAGLSINAVV